MYSLKLRAQLRATASPGITKFPDRQVLTDPTDPRRFRIKSIRDRRGLARMSFSG